MIDFIFERNIYELYSRQLSGLGFMGLPLNHNAVNGARIKALEARFSISVPGPWLGRELTGGGTAVFQIKTWIRALKVLCLGWAWS